MCRAVLCPFLSVSTPLQFRRSSRSNALQQMRAFRESSKEEAMEMRCYRKILHISYKDHVTNEEVCAKIQQAIGPHEDLLTIVKRRKLKWYGHVCRSSGLTKTISQGTVKGGRRQSGQSKRWEDNIRE